MPRIILVLLQVLPIAFLSAREVNLTIFQLNDVYEMSPVSGGTLGGLARVATVVKQLEAENPDTYTVLAGDMFNPSAIGTAYYEGEKIAGRQMVDLLNSMGWDFFVLGNHEFDLKEADMRKRCEEAEFQIIADNVTDAEGKLFPNTEPCTTFMVDGIKVGVLGLTLNTYSFKYAQVADPLVTGKQKAEELKAAGAEIILAITHQAIQDDVILAEEVPEINLVMGGHEHENYYLKRGATRTPITKADANAKTAFVHRLTYDTETKAIDVDSKLIVIDASIASDPEIEKEVQKWTEIAFASFREQGYEPEEYICTSTEELDGTEASVRSKPTALTNLITDGFYNAYAAAGADAAIMNGGTIRIDDTLMPGKIIQYDIMKISPFGGDICLVTMKGSILKKALDQGLLNVGVGSFLQYSKISQSNGAWQIGGKAIVDEQTYKIAMNEYLAENGDTNLEFLTISSGNLQRTDAANQDFFKVVIAQFKRQFPESSK
jgi:5''-nucleotidase/2'',3''-cyclic phosphodiesterase and related esterases